MMMVAMAMGTKKVVRAKITPNVAIVFIKVFYYCLHCSMRVSVQIMGKLIRMYKNK